MDNNEIIEILRKEIKRIAPEAKFILYGSRARGDFRNDSDVDLLVLLPDSFDKKNFVNRQSEISDGLYALSLLHNIDIAPLITVERVFYKRKTPFTINVINEGIRL